ncbi:MAG: SycD/LcrH family type III secretion system chaperone [Chlamydiota bacterium]|nr:SycD/LcrH family type III secretion system chaperone [Chlamydiota bacterium]
MDYMEEFKIPEDALEKLLDPRLLTKQFKEGKNFQEILGYSDETMEKFYQVGYNFFQKQNYEKSAEIFTFLTTLNPTVFNYWLGLGMAEQLLEEYHSALLAYAMAAMVDVSHPLPHYHTASCYRSILDDTSAISSLDLCILNATEKEEFEELLELAQKAKSQLE